MKFPKVMMLFSAVFLTTLISVYFTTSAQSYASKSQKDVLYTYADSTQSGDCCKTMSGCTGMGNGSMQNMDMSNDSMHNHMNMNKNDNTDMNSGEHEHQHENNNNTSRHSGCMGN